MSLIAIYPPLALLAENINEVGYFAANRTIIFSTLGALLLLVSFAKVYKDWQKAGFATSLLILLFLSYGHVYSLLEKVEIAGFLVGRHRYLLVVWTLLVAFVLYLAGRIQQLSIFEEALGVISIALVAFAVIRLFTFSFAEWNAVRDGASDQSVPQFAQIDISDGKHPDVYYIILDAYGRSDVLANSFGVDTSGFLESLRSRGFFVGSCSQSNYAHTHLSLASSLNYSYLDDLGSDFVPGNKSWSNLNSLIRNGAVRQFFEGKDYKVIAFETGFGWTEWQDADLFFERKDSFFSKNLTGFEMLFLYTTVFAISFDLDWIPEIQQNIQHYELIGSNLDVLENLATEDGPKFIFAHLVIPHHPFVFDENGGYRRDTSLSPAFENYSEEEYREGYSQQVTFLNARILEVVDVILSKSDRQPVIIIQGDHGPSHAGEQARMSILNAIYLPDISTEQLQNDITPVNTFRVVLNGYFDLNLPILPDRSYFSKNADPYAYTEIPKTCER